MKNNALRAGIVFLLIGGISLGTTLLLLAPQTNEQEYQESPTSKEEVVEEVTAQNEKGGSSEVTPETSFSISKLGTNETDIAYCNVEDTDLLMDLYWPPEGTGPFPLAIYVHGGGWSSGDKADNVQQYIRTIVPKGIVVAAVNYRLARDGEFPIMIEDVKCAVRHLRANAATYNIDPDKIAAFGGSAGGHLVNLLGTTDASAGWDTGAYENVSSRVAAVVDFFGPTDLRIPFEGNAARSVKNIFGTENYEDMGFASPITYITPDDPPFLIFHGNQDQLVPIEQSEVFVEALKNAGIDVTFVQVQNAGHSFAPFVEGEQISPTIPEIATQVSEWLVVHLE